MENTILFVDDEQNILNSLTRVFRREGYDILTAGSGEEGLEKIKANKVAVVVSDHRMPGMEGVEFLSKVKEISPSTIRFMLTGYADIKSVIGAINNGEVYRYITKPWNDDDLKLTIRGGFEHYRIVEENKVLHELTARQNAELFSLNQGLEAKVAEKTRKIRENFFGFVRLFADLMELYDQHVGGHSKRVAALSRGLADKIGLKPGEVDMVETAALLHNIGLIGIPRDILEKEEQYLQENEKALLKQNPILSQDLLSSIGELKPVGNIIRSHMEKYDGKGYPDGIKGTDIHIGARIIAVCKLFDGMSLFPSKKPLAEVFEIIKNERGKGLDPAVVDMFFELLKEYKEEDIHSIAPIPSGIKQDVTVQITAAKPGMVLAKNLVTGSGRLLITKGTTLTVPLIEKVKNFNNIDPIPGGFRITHDSYQSIAALSI